VAVIVETTMTVDVYRMWIMSKWWGG